LRAIVTQMRYFILVLCAWCSFNAYAKQYSSLEIEQAFQHKAYVGALGGFGSTTWQGLVPAQEKQNMAISISTPVSVEEGGGVWGLAAGYELTPYFALEANYQHYPKARVIFDPESLFAFEQEGDLSFETNTEVFSLSGRLMLVIPQTLTRVYSSIGLARVQRDDIINQDWRFAPTFGLGVNFNFTDHVMGEIGSNYTAGYGESELNPAEDYVPFLYSVFLKLAYRF
jgi:opacity protein-like surface antigen